MAKKNGILPKNGGSPMMPGMDKSPPMPRRLNIEKAEGGYSIRKSGGPLGYSDKNVVATDRESLEKCLDWLDGKSGDKEDKY